MEIMISSKKKSKIVAFPKRKRLRILKTKDILGLGRDP